MRRQSHRVVSPQQWLLTHGVRLWRCQRLGMCILVGLPAAGGNILRAACTMQWLEPCLGCSYHLRMLDALSNEFSSMPFSNENSI